MRRPDALRDRRIQGNGQTKATGLKKDDTGKRPLAQLAEAGARAAFDWMTVNDKYSRRRA
jgi:hypothetical protein